MKTNTKNTKLNLEKFQIAKLTNMNSIVGGAKTDNTKKESTSTDTWTTLTFGG
ncbi:hypothetical protein [uncultured Dokdonia sp.]|uniref:hypothetical protein n=1 Tax=uncultured Dokdonia sp. TaxID=575653 RepID=UPI0026204C73|nr:hypothetical protein [uncultured Dokdonia sp.]